MKTITDFKEIIINLIKKNDDIYKIAKILIKIIYSDLSKIESQDDYKFITFSDKLKKYYNNVFQEKRFEVSNFKNFNQKKFNSLNNKDIKSRFLKLPHKIHTFEIYVKIFLDIISPMLINAKQKYLLYKLIKQVPNDFTTSRLLFEFRLYDSELVDISMVMPGYAYFGYTSNSYPRKWNSISKLIKLSNHLNKTRVTIHVEGLEFDVNGTEKDITPSIFISFHHCFPNRINDLINILSKKLSIKISEKNSELIKNIINLSFEKSLCQIGLGYMCSRNQDTFKLMIKDFPYQLIVPFLNELNWKSDTNLLKNFLYKLSEFPYHLNLSVDVSNGKINDFIGIEIKLDTSKTHNFKEIFSLLIHEEICKPRKYITCSILKLFYGTMI